MEKRGRQRNRKYDGGGGVGKQRNGGCVVEKEGRQKNYSSGRGGEKTIELCRGDGRKEQNCGGGMFFLESVNKGYPVLLNFFSQLSCSRGFSGGVIRV